MTYLAALLADPGREIAAVDLAVVPRDAGTPAGRPAPDPGALHRYRDRLAQLQRDIERADRVGDPRAGIRAHAERDEILGRLQAIAGPDGLVSASGIDPERARVAVGKALRRALRRIATADREVADLIAASVHTGRYCVYLPADPR